MSMLALLTALAPFASQGSASLTLDGVANGFGTLLPHRIRELDSAGNPTSVVVEIRALDDLVANSSLVNRVLPVATWPASAVLPNGASGNHYVVVFFDRALDVDSVLSSQPGAPSQLTGAITVQAYDPATGVATPVQGRAFVAGFTYAGTPVGSPPALPLQPWVRNVGEAPVANGAIDNDSDGVADGTGFPGTQSGFASDERLLARNAFVFVADADGDLATHETFPASREIVVTISPAVGAFDGTQLATRARTASTVGNDLLRPEVLRGPLPANEPLIVPGSGGVAVDPATDVRIAFSEPLEPWSVGALEGASVALPSAAVSLTFGPPAYQTQVPVTVEPVSPFDLTEYRVIPAYAFPGEGPAGSSCGDFNRVDVLVNGGQLSDLAANTNVLAAATFFTTGEGPGLVNAPVTPDAIYVGSAGAVPSAGVVDLNGFGASTGDPTFDPTFTTITEGNTNYPNNPNVRLQGALMRPPLVPGSCTFNGGASGVFRFTRDSNLATGLVRAPLVASIGDMMLGHALDSTYSNGPAPFGCQAGGGDLCAVDGLKLVTPVASGPNTLAPGAPRAGSTYRENVVSWAPHPNPPPLVFPATCASPTILAQEPTSVRTRLAPPFGAGLTNLLVPGDPFGSPAQGVPPSGLLSPEQNSYFEGPTWPAQPTIGACDPYQIREQIGQFLYVLDRARGEVVVFNSNRMHVIDRIALPDPTEMAVGTNLDYLAVTNQLTDEVSFIDIDPSSSTFHEVVQTTQVGDRPRGIAWDPGNEDVLVCNEGDDSLSILSTSTLTVRKTVVGNLDRPFAVAITQRQANFGFFRNVYFGYVVCRDGRVAVFESGPNTVNGWGYDDLIGFVPQRFVRPKAIQPDPVDLRSAVWIAHEAATPANSPRLSRLHIASALPGAQPLPALSTPHFRDMTYDVTTIDATQLSGIPVDLAFDDLRNLGALPNATSLFGSGLPVAVNGKAQVRAGAGGSVLNTNEPRYLFVAVPASSGGTGAIDVFRLEGLNVRVDTNAFQPGVQSIPAPGVNVLASYFRQ